MRQLSAEEWHKAQTYARRWAVATSLLDPEEASSAAGWGVVVALQKWSDEIKDFAGFMLRCVKISLLDEANKKYHRHSANGKGQRNSYATLKETMTPCSPVMSVGLGLKHLSDYQQRVVLGLWVGLNQKEINRTLGVPYKAIYNAVAETGINYQRFNHKTRPRSWTNARYRKRQAAKEA